MPTALERPDNQIDSRSFWSRLITESLIVTLTATALFVWGKIYYTAFVNELGFPAATVSIQAFDVMFLSWPLALLAALVLLVARFVWVLEPVSSAAVAFLVAIAKARVRKLFGKPSLRTSETTRARETSKRERRLLAAIRLFVPKHIRDGARNFNHPQIPSLLGVGIVFAIFWCGIAIAASLGKNTANGLLAARSEHPVVLVYRDKSEIHGYLIASFGDSIFVKRDRTPDAPTMLAKIPDLLQIVREEPKVAESASTKDQIKQ